MTLRSLSLYTSNNRLFTYTHYIRLKGIKYGRQSLLIIIFRVFNMKQKKSMIIWQTVAENDILKKKYLENENLKKILSLICCVNKKPFISKITRADFA